VSTPVELRDAGIDIVADSWAAVADATRLIEVNVTVKRVNDNLNTASLSVLPAPAQNQSRISSQSLRDEGCIDVPK
jgi:hypothetical protein